MNDKAIRGSHRGSHVIFVYPNRHLQYSDIKNASTYLSIGHIYTVETIEKIDTFSFHVILQEFPNVRFPAAHFEDTDNRAFYMDNDMPVFVLIDMWKERNNKDVYAAFWSKSNGSLQRIKTIRSSVIKKKVEEKLHTYALEKGWPQSYP